jgi:hypothetical protein
MKFAIASDSPSTIERFKAQAAREGREKIGILVASGGDLGVLRKRGSGFLVYRDLAGLSPERVEAELLRLESAGFEAWAVIDPDGLVDDPAALIHRGAADYLGPRAPESAFSISRFSDAAAFAEGRAPARASRLEPCGSDAQAEAAYSAAHWDSLIEGTTYRFAFLYSQIEGAETLQNQMGEDRANRFLKAFKQLLDDAAASCKGIPWMWRAGSGVHIFPYEPGTSCIVRAFARFMVSWPVEGTRRQDTRSLTPFRLVLHVGDAAWMQPGKTGTLVSDALNSLFHLAQRHAPARSFTLTEPAFGMAEPRLEALLEPSGYYDGIATKTFAIRS